MDDAFDVHKYDIATFKKILIEKSDIDDQILTKTIHLTYFEEYFSNVNAKSIVVENSYVEKDFLEDFAAYYVSCFHEYDRFCTRLHFFKCDIPDKAALKEILSNPTEKKIKELQNNYIGFIVVKPLPLTIIGKTCLKTYDPDSGRRHYPIIRKYTSHLFGIPLVTETIAYQEQDSTVSACASTAIWAAFQGTGFLFHHQIPSPVEITKAATIHTPFSNRHFPNKGLTIEQMAHAIRNVGLEPFLVNVANTVSTPNKFLSYTICKGTAYAYLKTKIPLIFGFKLHDTTDYGARSNLNPRFMQSTAKHAVTITGFSMKPKSIPEKFLNQEFYLTSSRIDEIYVHDDGVGPFARMRFDNIEPRLLGRIDSLSTSWINHDDKAGEVRAIPEILLIALAHKIRIPYNKILRIVEEINAYLIPGYSKGLNKIEWDIHLIEISDLKSSILKTDSITEDERFRILTKELPKYLWRVLAKENDDLLLFDILFDATDIEQGQLFIDFVTYNENCLLFLKEYFTNHPHHNSKTIINPPVKEVVKIIENFQPMKKKAEAVG